MTSNIKVVDINEETAKGSLNSNSVGVETKQETNNETVEPVQEEEPNNEPAIENVVEPTEELANEPPVVQSTRAELLDNSPEVKPEPKKKEPPIPLDQPVKQNVRQQDKLVKCPKCDKQMKLKSYRYKHETTCKGKLEEIPRKPKAMPKPKVQPIIQEVREVQQPVAQQTVQQPIQNQIVQPSNPLTNMAHHYQLLQQQFMQQKKEKYNNLCQNMFAPKSKKR